MKKVCVITGGGSGIGLATAKVMGKDYDVIISGRTVEKLKNAIKELKDLGIEAQGVACDVSNRESVFHLAKRAKEIGEIEVVIHAAGLSPTMGDGRKLMEVNALGTVHINEVFFNYMSEGGCIIDVASMSGYFVPNFLIPKRAFELSRLDQQRFMDRMMRRVNLFPKKIRSQVAYGISKAFVIWYAKTDAAKFGVKNIRVLSVSPGSFETPMGHAEKDSLDEYIEASAMKRLGHVEEIAHLFAFLTDKKVGYLTGTDILVDGGCVASGIGSFSK